MTRGRCWTGVVLAVFAAGAGGATGSAAATLAGGVSARIEASTCEWPVTLAAAPGERVAAVQFDLHFNPKAIRSRTSTPVTAGREAKAAGKQVNCAEIAPGCIRVILAGLTQTTIANGEIAVAFFDVVGDRDSLPGRPVTIRDVLLAGPRGERIPAQVTVETVRAPAGARPSGRETDRFWPMAACLAAAAVAVALAAARCRTGRTRGPDRESEQP